MPLTENKKPIEKEEEEEEETIKNYVKYEENLAHNGCAISHYYNMN